MGSIEAAISELGPYKPGVYYNYASVARKFGLHRVTLSRRHKGVQGTKQRQYEEQKLLNNQQESELIKWTNKLTERGLYISSEMLRNFAFEICGTRPGFHWPARFIGRHEKDLVFLWTSGIDSNQKRVDPAANYALYFELLGRKIQEYDLQSENIYNMGEKGFLIGMVGKGKRIFSKQTYVQSGLKKSLQDGNREWITTIACICADGSSLSPSLIYQAASGGIQNTWLQDFKAQDHKCFFASSESGWTNDEVGFAWLRDIFDRETKGKARRRWRLLILDSHGSHLTMKFMKFCEENKIHIMTNPPHSTSTLQPLDVGIFSPLAQAYSKQLEAFMHDCQGLSSITKGDFFRLFWLAWGDTLSFENIESAWKSTGLHPWDPERILKKSLKKEDQRPSSNGSSKAVLQAEDWQNIERLLKKTVADIYDQNTKKLSATIHHLSTENVLLKLHCQGLERALLNEKKKRQRGKPLEFGLQASEDEYAVFYSPKKEKAQELAEASSEDEKLRRERAKE